MFSKTFSAFCSVVLLYLSHPLSAAPLTAAAVEWPPYQIYDGQEVRGIVSDMLAEISHRTGLAIHSEPTPMKRMLSDFRDGRTVIDPVSNPAWRSSDQTVSCYTLPYMQTQDVILVRKGSRLHVSSAADLHGKKLGCELGYAYADGFDEAFRQQLISREDVTTGGVKANLMRLSSGRVDGIIVNRLASDYWIRETGMNPDDFEVAYTFTGYSELFIRLHTSQQALLPVFNQALTELKNEGVIDRLIQKYTR